MKLAFFSLIFLIVVLCVYFFMPQGNVGLEDKSAETNQEISKPGESSVTEKAGESTEQETAEELLYQQKQETYAKLEKSRRNLDRVVARIKALSWKVNLPKEKAEAINKELLNAHGLLKNKKLLGAFTDLAAIQDELNKVQYSHGKITEYISYIKGLRELD